MTAVWRFYRPEMGRETTMGQYFQLTNIDKGEVVSLPGGMKAIERVTNPHAMGVLGFLLLEGAQDGTAFVGRNADPETTTPETLEAAGGDPEWYTDDDGTFDSARAARIEESQKAISKANEYAGRWAGDRVTLVGDYAEGGNADLYGDESLTNITEGVMSEFVNFVGEQWVESHDGGRLRPDMVLSLAGKDD